MSLRSLAAAAALSLALAAPAAAQGSLNMLCAFESQHHGIPNGQGEAFFFRGGVSVCGFRQQCGHCLCLFGGGIRREAIKKSYALFNPVGDLIYSASRRRGRAR